MAYPLGQPLGSLSTFFLLYLVSLCVLYSPFSCWFPLLLFLSYLLLLPRISFPSVDEHIVVSLSSTVSWWTLVRPATRKPNNLGHSWQTTPSKCNSGAFSLCPSSSRIPSGANGWRDLTHPTHSLPVSLSLFLPPSFNLILIFFPLAVFVHHRPFANTLQSDRLRGKIWRANVTLPIAFVYPTSCALATKSMAIFSSVTLASRRDIAIFIPGRQQTLAIRLADGRIFAKISWRWRDFASIRNSKFDVQCARVSELVSVSTAWIKSDDTSARQIFAELEKNRIVSFTALSRAIMEHKIDGSFPTLIL